MLFDPRAHEPLVDAEWRPADVEAEIRAIAREAEDAMHDGTWWPVHPLDADAETPAVIHGVYFGAAGMVWALHRLAQAGLHEPRRDHAQLARDVLDSYLRRPEFGGPVPSLWMGEGGIALVAWLLAPARELAERLAELVVADPEDDTLELMWGSPGLLLIADAMLERTGEERWASAWRAIADSPAAPAGRARPGPLDPAAVRLGHRDPRPRARARRDRHGARAAAGAAPSRPGARRRRHRGALGHRDPRRRARELAARLWPPARRRRRRHPHPVVPRRARHRRLGRRPSAG